MNDEAQIPAGLYGPLVVLEPGTKFDPAHVYVAMLSRGGPGPIAGPFVLNGSSAPATLHWQIGERYRLRLINIVPSDGGTFSLKGSEGQLQWRAAAKDGADLPPKQAVLQEARQIVHPGEIYDFEYQPTSPGILQIEFSNQLLQMKAVQQIEVR